MTLNFSSLLNEIDIVLDEIEVGYQQVPGLILTEDDLKCVLVQQEMEFLGSGITS